MKNNGVIGVVGTLIALFSMLTGWVALSIAWQAFTRGPIPTKSLTYQDLGATDALSALRNAEGAINVTIDAEEKPLHNLFSVTVFLQNTGSAPILPSDIYQNIT